MSLQNKIDYTKNFDLNISIHMIPHENWTVRWQNILL